MSGVCAATTVAVAEIRATTWSGTDAFMPVYRRRPTLEGQDRERWFGGRASAARPWRPGAQG